LIVELGMKIISKTTNFNFMGMAIWAYLFSGLLVAGSVYLWFSKGEAKYGIDYAGGYELVVEVAGDNVAPKLRGLLDTAGIAEAMVQSFEAGSDEYAVRIPISAEQRAKEMKSEEIAAETSRVKQVVKDALVSGFGASAEIIATDYVGPTISEELKGKAVTALVLGLLAILLYVTFRFELSFAIGAVAALFHDVIVCTGVYLLMGKTLSMTALAAALTIIGYSINDTIVIFDRIREELVKDKKSSVEEIMNFSINATLSRTIITSLLTFFSALSLMIFGGGAISDLSVFLVVGIIAGSYSTIFIASPIALAWERFRARAEERKEAKAEASVLSAL
jgi:preprotein translocase SecF subunit